MIRVSVLYPYSPTVKFDMTYYLHRHITMVQRLVGPALKHITVEQGLAGGTPGDLMTYATIAHLTFDSLDAFRDSFGAHAAEIMADVPNYSNVQPTVQISEVKL
jgi:uncharacterized protein (TIGR02118 family)